MKEGERRKQEGMARALAAKPYWTRMAYHTINRQPEGMVIKSEWLTARIGLPQKKIGQHRNNAVGGVMNACAKFGLLKKVDIGKAHRPVSHANLRYVWVRTDVFRPDLVMKRIVPRVNGTTSVSD